MLTLHIRVYYTSTYYYHYPVEYRIVYANSGVKSRRICIILQRGNNFTLYKRIFRYSLSQIKFGC